MVEADFRLEQTALRGPRRPGDRIRFRQNVVEQHTDAVDVASDRGVFSGRELWCEIERCAREACRAIVAKFASGAEIHEHNSPIVRHHHVLRLDVAVQEACSMYGRNGVTELDPDLYDRIGTEQCTVPQKVFERSAP
jgi:hypothetical protein